MLDPVQIWASKAGLTSKEKDPMSYSTFSSNAARAYGQGYDQGLANFGLGGSFSPITSGTRSMMEDYLDERKSEADFATNALGALTSMKIAQMQPQGGAQPKQESFGKSLLRTGVGAAVGAGVSALV